jgi:hypothetical protein
MLKLWIDVCNYVCLYVCMCMCVGLVIHGCHHCETDRHNFFITLQRVCHPRWQSMTVMPCSISDIKLSMQHGTSPTTANTCVYPVYMYVCVYVCILYVCVYVMYVCMYVCMYARNVYRVQFLTKLDNVFFVCSLYLYMYVCMHACNIYMFLTVLNKVFPCMCVCMHAIYTYFLPC